MSNRTIAKSLLWILLSSVLACEKDYVVIPVQEEAPYFGVMGEYYDETADGWRDFSVQLGTHPDEERFGWVFWQSDREITDQGPSLFSGAFSFKECCTPLFQLRFWSDGDFTVSAWGQQPALQYFVPGRFFPFGAGPRKVEVEMWLPIAAPNSNASPGSSSLASPVEGGLDIQFATPYQYEDHLERTISGLRVTARLAGRIGGFDPVSGGMKEVELRDCQVVFFVRITS